MRSGFDVLLIQQSISVLVRLSRTRTGSSRNDVHMILCDPFGAAFIFFSAFLSLASKPVPRPSCSSLTLAHWAY